MDCRFNLLLNVSKTVATFLHKTYRYEKAITFYHEFLVLLNLLDCQLVNLKCSIYMRLAVANFCLGKCEEATEMGKTALELSKSSGDKGYEGNACTILSFLYFERGDFDKTIEYQEELLELSRAAANTGKIEVYYNMTLGIIYSRNKGQYKQSTEYFEKGLAQSKAFAFKQEERACYCYLAGAYMALGQLEKSINCNNKSLEISQAIGDRGPCDGTIYAQLGMAYNFLGQNEKSLDFYKKAFQVFKRIGWEEGEGVCYSSLAVVYYDLAQYDESIAHLEKALQIFKTRGSPQEKLACYINLGAVYQILCQYDKSIEILEKALVLCRQDENKRFEEICYNTLSCVFNSTGQYERSIHCLEKALQISKEIGHRPGEGASLNNLANVYLAIGQWEKSIEYGKEGLICCKALGNKEGEADALNHLGSTNSAMAQYEQSIQYFTEALEISKESGSKHNEASSYCGIGSVFCSLGDFEKSKEHLEKSIEIYHAIGAQRGEAFSYAKLGVTYHCLGLLEKSVECQEKALRIFRENGNKGDVRSPLVNLGFLHAVGFQGYQRATDYFAESIKSHQMIWGTLADELKLCIDDMSYNIFPQKMLCFLLVAQGKAEAALCCLEQGRARALVDLMITKYGIHKVKTKEEGVTIERSRFKKRKSDFLFLAKFARCVYIWFVSRSGHMHFKITFLNMDRYPTEIDEFFSKAMKQSPSLVNGKEPDGKFEDRSLSALYDVKLSDVDKVRTETKKDSFRRPNSGSETHSPNHHSLYNTIISSVSDLIKGPEIIIVPEGPLFLTPFAALQDSNGKYLSETVRIRLIPSLTTLEIIQDSPADYHCNTGALIVGDPKVGRVKVSGKVKKLYSLPSARKEAEMIGRLLGVSCLVGEQATKEEVLRRIQEVSLVHIAAHGDAERGEIALAPNKSVIGIPKEKDFLLTMKDIAEVCIRAKLVVLSCCHSARGKILTAEGVVGIARAFLGSGARSVLISLWAVGDEATKEFMDIFYRGLVREKLSACEALHQTMKNMRESRLYSDETHWAPFVLLGDDVTFDFS